MLTCFDESFSLTAVSNIDFLQAGGGEELQSGAAGFNTTKGEKLRIGQSPKLPAS